MSNTENPSEKIDFVIYWVDGGDINWLNKKKQYKPGLNTDTTANRYRDMETVRYLMRGIDRFCPWVNKVYFISDEQTPAWLNTEHPKLVMVDHKDYIPTEYLPTFSANPIELNLHRIKGLSEHFVVFNDDFLVIKDTTPEDFFVNGVPKDIFMEYPIMCSGVDNVFSNLITNGFNMIGKHFERKEYKKRLRSKILSPKYGAYFFYNLILYFIPYPKFFGLLTPHFCRPYLKATFEEVWKEEHELLDRVCHNRFRSTEDINIYPIRIWNLMKGNFIPENTFKKGKAFLMRNKDDADNACAEILRQKRKFICVNDVLEEQYYDYAKEHVLNALETIMPGKSEFEL